MKPNITFSKLKRTVVQGSPTTISIRFEEEGQAATINFSGPDDAAYLAASIIQITQKNIQVRGNQVSFDSEAADLFKTTKDRMQEVHDAVKSANKIGAQLRWPDGNLVELNPKLAAKFDVQ